MRLAHIILLLMPLLAAIVIPDSALCQQTTEGIGNSISSQTSPSWNAEKAFSSLQKTETGSDSGQSMSTTKSGGSGYTDKDFLRDQIVLQGLVIVMLCLVTVASLVLILRVLDHRGASSAHLVSGAGLTLIIFGTVFLTYVVQDKTQLTASVGILGAIAGYLFGTSRYRENQRGE